MPACWAVQVSYMETLRCAMPAVEPDTFNFELSIPVTASIMAAGRVQPSTWPAMRMARALYHGAYEGLPAAWGHLDDWLEAHGYAPAADLYECYLAGPDSSPDPANWCTELNRPLTH